MTRTRRLRTALIVVAVVAIGVIGFGIGRLGGGDGAAPAEEQLWTCPMHPEYVSDQPGSCPICGMDLVPVNREGTAAAEGGSDGEVGELVAGLSTVHLTEARRQLSGVTTVAAQIRSTHPTVRTVGIVTADETSMRTVNAKVGGFVEKLFVDFEGAPIRAGEPMLTIYSPQLYQTQQEYLAALAARRQLASSQFPEVARAGEQMVEAAERRLRLWDIPQSDIDRLRRGGEPRRTMTLYAPVSGIVVKRLVEAGMEIKPGAPLLHVADLSSVWVEADVYEQDLKLVEPGQIATVTFAAYPGESWNGRVEYVYPYLEGQTRTLKARLSLRNPDGRLRPEMYAEVTLDGAESHVLAVPADAVIRTGERHLVYVETQEGVYTPRAVETGIETDGWVEVLSGLREGERVVERGLFMIDSESRLRASVAGAAAGGRED